MYIIEKSLRIAESIMPRIYNPQHNRNWHFCLAFRKNKLLAVGTNDMSTESAHVLKLVKRFKLKQQYLFPHAEQDAISRLWGRTYIDYRIRFVVLRLNKFYKLGESKPCEDCAEILNALGVEDIYWSNSRGTFSNKNGEIQI